MNMLGSRVMLVRKRAGFSQAELAKRIDVTPGAINKIESGETKGAKPEILAALGRTLGVSMEWLAPAGRSGSQSRRVFTVTTPRSCRKLGAC